MASNRYTTKLSPILRNKTVNTYSPTVFSLITIIVFIVFAIRPTVKTIISLQKTIDDQNKILAQLKLKNQNLATGINNFNSIPDDTKLKLFTLLPNSTDVTCLLSDLANMSGSSGTSVVGVQVQTVELNKPAKCLLDSGDLADYRNNISSEVNLNEIDFITNSQASFAQLSGYLNLFNASTRLINVQSATFSKQVDGPLNLTVNASAYFYK